MKTKTNWSPPALPALPESWTKLLVAVSKQGEISAAVLILLIVLMMILPLPTLLVDLLIGVNLSASLLLIVLSLYLPGAEQFTSFPSVLLLSTLFRLGIEISTSRLILLQGDAGHIVETFGQFVVGGNLVVGLIIFLIIAIVQFLGITPGAERVAEVSARFMLDSIPGKQMAIDSDLRAGLISLRDVKRIRAEMTSEVQMHGAMDGDEVRQGRCRRRFDYRDGESARRRDGRCGDARYERRRRIESICNPNNWRWSDRTDSIATDLDHRRDYDHPLEE